MKFIMPLKIQIGRKYLSINLNSYRNWHYLISNKIKIEYSKLVHSQVKEVKKLDKISLRLTLYPPNNMRRDRANYLSIHEKFFCDAIVSAGIIEDDSDKYIVSSFYSTGMVDKNNPRVEIEID